MTVELLSVAPRHERRIRLVFSNTLAAGAFTSTSLYVITNEDGRGVNPGVAQAIPVSGSSSNVELALTEDLVSGALYRLVAVGVPATDASTTTAASDTMFRTGVPQTDTNVERRTNDADVLLYGRDASWSGDYLESAEGDLQPIEGVANARAALERSLLGFPLAWAPGYSANAYEFVDAPSTAVGTLQGRLQAAALADDRVKSAVVTLVESDPDDVHFDVAPKLVGSTSIAPIPVNVKV